MVKIVIGKNEGITQAIKREIENQCGKGSVTKGNSLSVWQNVMTQVRDAADAVPDDKEPVNTDDASISKLGNKTTFRTNFKVKLGQVIELADDVWNNIMGILTGKPQHSQQTQSPAQSSKTTAEQPAEETPKDSSTDASNKHSSAHDYKKIDVNVKPVLVPDPTLQPPLELEDVVLPSKIVETSELSADETSTPETPAEQSAADETQAKQNVDKTTTEQSTDASNTHLSAHDYKKIDVNVKHVLVPDSTIQPPLELEDVVLPSKIVETSELSADETSTPETSVEQPADEIDADETYENGKVFYGKDSMVRSGLVVNIPSQRSITDSVRTTNTFLTPNTLPVRDVAGLKNQPFSDLTLELMGQNFTHTTKLLDKASSFLGIQEVTPQEFRSLTSEQKQQTQMRFIGRYGNPTHQWCAHAVSTIAEESGMTIGGHKAQVQQFVNWASNRGTYNRISTSTITPQNYTTERSIRAEQVRRQLPNMHEGDFIIWKTDYAVNGPNNNVYTTKSSHIGIIEHVNIENGVVTVIEGNANEYASADGYERIKVNNSREGINGAQNIGEPQEVNRRDGLIRKQYTIEQLANFGYSGFIDNSSIVA